MNNDINSSAAAIGIDLGGTKTEAIILNLDGSVLWRQRRPTPRADGYDAVLAIVAQMILEGVAQLSGARNPLIAIWTTLADLWGGLISVLDPDAVVLGGGLSNIGELYTDGRERVKKYAFHDKLHTPILKNQLGDSAGVFGAAWIGQAEMGEIDYPSMRR